MISNYRGIAKLSAIPKLLEKIITEQITHFVASTVSPKQHGFLKGCSTVTNLLEFASTTIDGFSNRLQTDTIFTDFSKAFDRVDHKLLLLKLDKIGFPGSLVNWIKSYLSSRRQCVVFNHSVSDEILVSSGVPQGNHLGPILFMIFINDLPSVVVHSNILMFADDVKLFKVLNDLYDCELLQHDLDNLSTWCKVNRLDLNVDKCKCMTFHRRSMVNFTYRINNMILERVDLCNDLGILLDHKLNFTEHIVCITAKATGTLGFIKRWSKEFSDPYTTKLLYTSLVRPILEYGCVLWNPQYNLHTCCKN